MHTHHTNSRGDPNRVRLGKFTAGLTAAVLLASASAILMPTAASAFDINGLVQGAIAQYASQYVARGYRFPGIGGHYGGVQVVSHSSRHSDDDDDDATPGSTNTPPARQVTDTPPHLSGDRMVAQSSDNGRMMTAVRSYGEDPTFAPSR
jgi:hypothetical protein